MTKARIYTLPRLRPEAEDASPLRGILQFYTTWAGVLFDTGASYSFIYAHLVQSLGLAIEHCNREMDVETPMGKIVIPIVVCRNSDK